MKYCIFDLETTVIESFKRFSNPFDPRNKIIVASLLLQDDDPIVIYDKEGLDKVPIPYDDIDFIVGHNLKFDLLYIWHDPDFQEWIKNGGRVWDTMTAEYLLSGQELTYPSLNYVAQKYGGELKDDDVTEYFKAGIGADEIPLDKLLPYAEQDVINTEIVLKEQGKQARQTGMMNILLAYMDHYLALCEMEFQGLKFDKDNAQALRREYEASIKESQGTLANLVQNYWTLDVEYNPASDEHNSAVLFNSDVVIETVVQLKDENGELLRYGPKAQKAGEIKTRREKINYKNKGFNIPRAFTNPTKKKNVYSTDKKVLGCIVAQYKQGPIVEFIKNLIEYREQEKTLRTYLFGVKTISKTKEVETGLLPLVHPDGCIHHTLDCVQTKTGRVNSRNPNGQNIPRELTYLFVSRFENGIILALDYSQLEVVVQAYLSQSKNMIQDIKNGVDFHAKRLAYAVDKPYEDVVQLINESTEWKDKRKKAKVISFQKAYGAHPTKISADTNLPVEVVQKVFDKEDADYPEINVLFETVVDEVKRTTEVRPELVKIRDKRRGITFEKEGEYRHVGFYQSITGKRYHFRELASWTKYDKIFRYYPSTDMCNFMVQGTAADIMAMQVSRLFRFLKQNHSDKCVLINEVHDEVVLDCKSEYVDELVPQIKEILEDVDGSFQERFGMRFNVPISVEVGQGKSWGETKR